MIDITYTVTQQEYLAAQLLYLKHAQAKRRTFRWIWSAVMLAGVGVYLTASYTAPLAALEILLGYAALFAAVYLVIRIMRKIAFKKRFLVESRYLSDIHTVIDAKGVTSTIKEIGSSTVLWAAYTKWQESPEVFVLFSGYTFRPIPTRVLTADQKIELRSLLSSSIATSSAETVKA